MSEREEDLIKLLVERNENENEKRDITEACRGGGGRGSYISILNVFVAYSGLCNHCRNFGRGRLSLVAISYWRSVATF